MLIVGGHVRPVLYQLNKIVMEQFLFVKMFIMNQILMLELGLLQLKLTQQIHVWVVREKLITHGILSRLLTLEIYVLILLQIILLMIMIGLSMIFQITRVPR